MAGAEPSLALIGSFNLSNLASLLSHDGEMPVRVVEAPFGQVMQTLMDARAECWNQGVDAAVVWTRPEDVIDSYARFRAGEEVSESTILDEVDAFAAALVRAAGRVPAVLVPSWTQASDERGLGLLEMRPGLGLAHTLMRMNLRLVGACTEARGVYVLDSRRWLAATRMPALEHKLWYLAKVAYAPEVLREAAADLQAALRALGGGARKLVVVDLDDTLWGGIVGDVGWEKLRLGGHDPLGEAHQELQRELKALSRRGVVLGIVSKNEEAVALEAIDRHPEMVLRRGDFAGWRINWRDKAQNLAELVAELRLGLQSVVFLDDNPVERARVREALPEVLVPELPADPLLFVSALRGLRCFDLPVLSAEDRSRTDMYRAELERSRARVELGSLDEWLAGLETVLRVETLQAGNLPRAAQLFNKTNQMNLSTRRMTAEELACWADGTGRQLWTFSVRDRFGDSGLTGIAGVETDGGEASLVDFILSCRVMGRRVEEAMLHVVVEALRASSATRVVARLEPTAKNMPCRRFFDGCGWRSEGDGIYAWDLAKPYPMPSQIHLERPACDGA